VHYTKDHLIEQHMLLHSKLWTRRWPGLQLLLIRIGVATIPPPPQVPRPVHLVEMDPPKLVYQSLEHQRFDITRKPPLKLPDDAATVIRRKLGALDCPAQRGWKMNSSEGPEVLCRCGGGSHKLMISEVVQEIEPLGFDGGVFRQFVHGRRKQYNGQDVNILVKAFIDTDGQDVVQALGSERQKIQERIDREEEAYQALLASSKEASQKQQEICQGFEEEFREGQQSAERLYIKHCVSQVRSVLGEQIEVETVEAARRELAKAKRMNDERRATWAEWQKTVECWSDVPEVFESRPDLVDAVFDKDDAAAKEEQAKRQELTLLRKIEGCYPDRAAFSDRLAKVQEDWACEVKKYESC